MRILLICVLLLSGCIPSIHPLYLPRDLVKDPLIEGLWMEDDAKTRHTWSFTAHKSGYYTARQEENGKFGEYEARLLRLSGRLYLDLYPVTSGHEPNDLRVTEWWSVHFPAAHTFYKLDLTAGKLEMWSIDDKWLNRLLAGKPTELEHLAERKSSSEVRLVITAPTKSLQAFILRHRNDPAMWGDEPFRLVRKKEEERK